MGIRFCILVLVLVASACTAAPDPVESNLPDVLVWIDARAPGAHWVSLTYPGVLKKEKAQAHLSRLLQETGWQAANTNISDESLTEGGENPMTSAEFMTAEAVKVDSGLLDIEPIITALKELKEIEIHYLVPPAFKFDGLEDYENKYVKITFAPGEGAYQYNVEVKRSDFEKLDLPLRSREDRVGRGYQPIAIVLLIILALLGAAVVYTLTARLTRSKQRRASRRS